jgi:hypothetical protein
MANYGISFRDKYDCLDPIFSKVEQYKNRYYAGLCGEINHRIKHTVFHGSFMGDFRVSLKP